MHIIKETIRELFNKRKMLQIFFFLCGMVLINILPFPCSVVAKGYSEPVFSITSDNEPLNEALGKIAQSTRYKIEITKGLEDKPLTVNLKKIALEKGLREIMRIIGEPNYAIVVNDRLKKVEIRIFNDSLPGQKKGSVTYGGTSPDLHKKEKAAAEREMVDVDMDMEKRMKHEEPPDIDIAPPKIDIEPPEVEIIPPE